MMVEPDVVVTYDIEASPHASGFGFDVLIGTTRLQAKSTRGVPFYFQWSGATMSPLPMDLIRIFIDDAPEHLRADGLSQWNGFVEGLCYPRNSLGATLIEQAPYAVPRLHVG
jgi:hypothetical protein